MGRCPQAMRRARSTGWPTHAAPSNLRSAATSCSSMSTAARRSITEAKVEMTSLFLVVDAKTVQL